MQCNCLKYNYLIFRTPLDMKNTKIISFRGISITIKIEFVNNKRFDIKRM